LASDIGGSSFNGAPHDRLDTIPSLAPKTARRAPLSASLGRSTGWPCVIRVISALPIIYRTYSRHRERIEMRPNGHGADRLFTAPRLGWLDIRASGHHARIYQN